MIAHFGATYGSVATVVIFLVLFVDSCAGYFVWVWWNERKKRQLEEAEKAR
jgi:uncharacterized BrkB/YihY/UPF0761 family membrane protein